MFNYSIAVRDGIRLHPLRKRGYIERKIRSIIEEKEKSEYFTGFSIERYNLEDEESYWQFVTGYSVGSEGVWDLTNQYLILTRKRTLNYTTIALIYYNFHSSIITVPNQDPFVLHVKHWKVSSVADLDMDLIKEMLLTLANDVATDFEPNYELNIDTIYCPIPMIRNANT